MSNCILCAGLGGVARYHRDAILLRLTLAGIDPCPNCSGSGTERPAETHTQEKVTPEIDEHEAHLGVGA